MLSCGQTQDGNSLDKKLIKLKEGITMRTCGSCGELIGYTVKTCPFCGVSASDKEMTEIKHEKIKQDMKTFLPMKIIL